MAKDEPIVTYRTYYDPMLAHIEQSRLEDSGIHCFISDENVATINPFYNTAIGGIKLRVFERDIAQCDAILGIDESAAIEEPANASENTETAATCPNCGSVNTRYGNATEKPHSWYGILFAVLISSWAIGVMPMFARKSWHCFDCGKDFKKE
jgi:DNA-directed RNA polymerase subunit RPC12/RpoP